MSHLQPGSVSAQVYAHVQTHQPGFLSQPLPKVPTPSTINAFPQPPLRDPFLAREERRQSSARRREHLARINASQSSGIFSPEQRQAGMRLRREHRAPLPPQLDLPGLERVLTMGHSTQKPKHAAMVGLGAKVFVGGVRAAENYRRDAVREGKKAEKVGKKGGKFRAVRRV